MTDSMKVIELVVENYMGVKAVQIRPIENVVRIEGKNGAGKSSVINAIWAAIGGAPESGQRPLRDGAAKGRSFVDLGEIRVERKFTPNGAYLEVSDRDGRKIPRPQEFLNQFYTKTTIDPRNFITMGARERRDLLLDLTGKRGELDELDEQRAALYEERTLTNREVKVLQGKLVGRGSPGDVPDEVPIAGLLAELEASLKSDAELDEKRRDVENADRTVRRCRDSIASYHEQINKLREEIAKLERCIGDAEAEGNKAAKWVESAPASRTGELRAQIAEVEKTNQIARAGRETVELQSQLKTKQSESETLSDEISGIDERKVEILQESALSIGSVGFDGDMLLINGKPFDDLSTSEKLKVSLEIGISQNPDIRVLRISDGNVFDDDSMDEIELFAMEHDCQIWIEKVAKKPGGAGFFIEDGQVKE